MVASAFLDVTPYLEYEVFQALRDQSEFRQVSNGEYFVEWDCDADLPAYYRSKRVKMERKQGNDSASFPKAIEEPSP